MSNDKIREAIERLRALSDNYGAHDINVAFMGSETWYLSELRDALVEVLETVCDSAPLPKDANGETIRLGDSVRYKDADAVLHVHYIYIETDPDGPYMVGVASGKDYWAATPSALVHHHEPTVETLLRQFWADVQEGDDLSERVDKYAEKIRELMQA